MIIIKLKRMLRYRSPFGITAQASKTMIKMPIKTQSSGLQFWSPSPLRRKNTSATEGNQSSPENESQLRLTNLTVDSINFGSEEFKTEKKLITDVSKKLKLTWNMKKRQSIIKREDNKRKNKIGRFFSLKAKQATIHAVHSPEELRYSVNSWKQAIIDRSIEKLTFQLKQLFNLRNFRKSHANSQRIDKQLGRSMVKKNCTCLKKFDSLVRQKQDNVFLTSNTMKQMKKQPSHRQNQWVPWNQNSKRKVQKEILNSEIVSQWYDRNFSITLD